MAINSHVIYSYNVKKYDLKVLGRKTFIRDLAYELIKPQMEYRLTTKIPNKIRESIQNILNYNNNNKSQREDEEPDDITLLLEKSQAKKMKLEEKNVKTENFFLSKRLSAADKKKKLEQKTSKKCEDCIFPERRTSSTICNGCDKGICYQHSNTTCDECFIKITSSLQSTND